MTRTLETLKRLHRMAIDAHAEHVALLAAQGAALDAEAAGLRTQLHAETTAAAGDPLAAAMLGAFTQQVRTQLAGLSQTRAQLLAREDKARDALAEAFLEEKKVEALIDAAQLRTDAAVTAAENAFLDEMAITLAVRRAK